MQFDVFLSHNSRDKPSVRQLAKALRQKGIKPYLDEEQIAPGRDFIRALEEAIEACGSAAVLVGKDGIGPWETREIWAVLNEAVERQMPVIPVLMPGAPQEPQLPLFLKTKRYVDLRDGLTETGLDELVWAITALTPKPVPVKPSPDRRFLFLAWGSPVAVFLAYWVGLVSLVGKPIEQDFHVWLERILIDAAKTPLAPDLVLIAASENAEDNGPLGAPGRGWRRYHAELIEGLSRAGARVVAFDLIFEEEDPSDGLMAQAIERALARRTGIVLATRGDRPAPSGTDSPGPPEPRLSDRLRRAVSADNWGSAEASRQGTHFIHAVKLADLPQSTTGGREIGDVSASPSPGYAVLESGVRPRFSLQVLIQALAAERQEKLTGFFKKGRPSHVEIRNPAGRAVRSIPVDDSLRHVLSSADSRNLEIIKHRYHEVYARLGDDNYMHEFAGKLVLIGFELAGELRFVSVTYQQRHGFGIQATIISDLYQQSFVKRPTAMRQFWIVLAVGILSTAVFIAAEKLGKVRITLSAGLLVLPYLTAAYWLMSAHRILLTVDYHVAAILIPLALVRRAYRHRRSADFEN